MSLIQNHVNWFFEIFQFFAGKFQVIWNDFENFVFLVFGT